MSEQKAIVRCGDCAHFVRDGKCRFFDTLEGKAKDRPFAHAPFWVWSDCYSDKEQVRANVKTMCSTFASKIPATSIRAAIKERGEGGGSDGAQGSHPMLDGYSGSVMDSSPVGGHKLAVFYATREQADAAQAWLAAGVEATMAADTVERLCVLMAEAAASPGKSVTIPADLTAALASESFARNREAILEIRRREYMPSRDGVGEVQGG